MDTQTHADAEIIPADLPRVGSASMIVGGLCIGGLLAGLFVLGYFPHRTREAQALADAAEMRDSKPVVTAVAPRRQAQSVDLSLPGDVQAYQATSIYPRAN